MKATNRVILICLLFPLRFALAEEAPIKLGASLALSGKYAFIGEAERDGLILGVEEENQRGGINGHPLALFIEDNAGDAKSAVSGARKLLSLDRVDLFFSAFTHITQAVQPVVSSAGVFLLYASSVREIAEQNEHVFRDYLDIREDANVMARYIISQDHRRLGYMRDEGEVCSSHEESFRRQIQNAGVEIAHREEFTSGDSDLKATLLRLYTSKKIDAVLFCAWRDAETVMRRLKELGRLQSLPIYHSLAPFLPVADSASMRALYEQSKAVSTWYGFLESDPTDVQREFLETFNKRFGRMPRPDAAYTYDNVLILSRALKSCRAEPGKIDRACISKFLLGLDYEGAAGRLRFSQGRVSSRPVFLMQVERGKWRSLRGWD